MANHVQKTIESAGPLLDAQGNLAQVGWSRQPMLDCNLENVRFYDLRFLQWLRVKRWDYYGLMTPDEFYSFTVSDIGYIGSIFAYRIDLRTGEYHEETLTVPLARGVRLPRNSTEGVSVFDNGRVHLEFRVEPPGRRLIVNWPNFEGQGLKADLALRLPPEHESMVIVIPIGKKRFYYNRKINCVPAEGWIEHGARRIEARPEETLANLDWGRGVWEYASTWVWASASGFLKDGRRVGLNLGCGFGDTSAATENALILNGRIHKLGQVDFDFDPKNYMRPWKMTSPDGRLKLELTPFKERVAKTDLKVLRSEVHQMFGRYSGTVATDDGEAIKIDGPIGFAEEHHARW